MKLVSARTGSHLDLRRTAPLDVHGGYNESNFLDHVRIDICRRSYTLFIPSIVYSLAVHLDINVTAAPR